MSYSGTAASLGQRKFNVQIEVYNTAGTTITETISLRGVVDQASITEAGGSSVTLTNGNTPMLDEDNSVEINVIDMSAGNSNSLKSSIHGKICRVSFIPEGTVSDSNPTIKMDKILLYVFRTETANASPSIKISGKRNVSTGNSKLEYVTSA